MQHTPTVHILLASYNGAKYLPQQLASIAQQTHYRWTLTVSDDGSTDDTRHIIQRFAQSVNQSVTLLNGPKAGSSTLNFFHLIQHIKTNNSRDLYAFCDQDDVWLPHKLDRAVHWHLHNSNEAVRLYCARTQLVNEQLKPIGLSSGIQRPPSFGNALVQNIASGNTMVMSEAVIMAEKKILPQHSVWHDWTTYLAATAVGGRVWFDDEPCLLYRQHDANVIGANNGLVAQFNRLKPLLEGRFKLWTDTNLSAVCDLNGLLTQENLILHQQFNQLRSTPAALNRLRIWKKTVIRRQRFVSNFTLGIGLLLSLI